MPYIAKVTIEFTTSCLASEFDDSAGVRRFERDKHKNLVFAVKYWRSMLKLTLEDYFPHYVQYANKLLADTLHFGKTAVDIEHVYDCDYEVLPEGFELTVEICVPDELALPEFQKILEFAGRFVGFSPAKAHLGAGRFKVLSVKAIASTGR